MMADSGTQTREIDAAEALARWWAEKIGGRVWHDNGDKSEAGFVAGGLMGLIAAKDPDPADEAYEVFTQRLAERIRASFANSGGHRAWVSIGTDYGPDLILSRSAEEAGIPFSRFPWKTHSSATPDYVTVQDGYGRGSVLIWSAPGWERPVCNQQKYTMQKGDIVYEPLACTLPQWHAEDHGEWTEKPLCTVCGEPESGFYHQGGDWKTERHHDFGRVTDV